MATTFCLAHCNIGTNTLCAQKKKKKKTQKNGILFPKASQPRSAFLGNEENLTAIEHYKIRWYDIFEVCPRYYIHQPMALEITTRRGMTFFLVLHFEARQRLYRHILKKSKLKPITMVHFFERMRSGISIVRCPCQMFLKKKGVSDFLMQQFNNSNAKTKISIKCAQTLWQNNLISNFDYLMYLNHMAGRSFQDVTQFGILCFFLFFTFFIIFFVNMSPLTTF